MHTYKNKFPETVFILTICDEIYFLFYLIWKKKQQQHCLRVDFRAHLHL